jgi:hypothetical protein
MAPPLPETPPLPEKPPLPETPPLPEKPPLPETPPLPGAPPVAPPLPIAPPVPETPPSTASDVPPQPATDETSKTASSGDLISNIMGPYLCSRRAISKQRLSTERAMRRRSFLPRRPLWVVSQRSGI